MAPRWLPLLLLVSFALPADAGQGGESRPRYAVLVTADHGRGRAPEDWTHHGEHVPSSDETWIFVAGPNVPAVGVANAPAAVFQNQVASTVLEALGIDPEALAEDAGRSLANAIASARDSAVLRGEVLAR